MNTTIVAYEEEKVKQEVINKFRKRYKISVAKQIKVYEKLVNNEQTSSRDILLEENLLLSMSQINRLRQEWNLSRKRGRPKKQQKSESKLEEIIHIEQAGMKLFAKWLESEEKHEKAIDSICEKICEYKQDNETSTFRLLNSSRETIAKKWLSLSIAGLLGIKKLSELDYKQHNMHGVLGYSYGYSSLRQFLDHLEKIGIENDLNVVLCSDNTGNYVYMDGHMIELWSKQKMHKGYITMMGRIMPGTNAVIAHNEFGEALWCQCYPPDIHLTQIVEDYCTEIVNATEVSTFIIDREVNSVDIAKLFIEKRWDLICLLDANQYKGLDSFCKRYAGTLDDGTVLYKATWKDYSKDDPRIFVIAKQDDRILVYWGTPNIARKMTAKQIVQKYRLRADVQENSIKHLVAHQAFNTNFGTKTTFSQDRTYQRKLDKLNLQISKLQARENKASQQIEFQHQKISQSVISGHQKRLDQRLQKLTQLEQHKNALSDTIDQFKQALSDLGQPSVRLDRDFRKQNIMSFRSLFIHNQLLAFFALVCAFLSQPISITVFIELFLYRSGFLVENDSEIVYWLETDGLSAKFLNILVQLVRGFNSISLVSGGKVISLKLLDFP